MSFSSLPGLLVCFEDIRSIHLFLNSSVGLTYIEYRPFSPLG
jgi:hypothetical protein